VFYKYVVKSVVSLTSNCTVMSLTARLPYLLRVTALTKSARPLSWIKEKEEVAERRYTMGAGFNLTVQFTGTVYSTVVAVRLTAAVDGPILRRAVLPLSYLHADFFLLCCFYHIMVNKDFHMDRSRPFLEKAKC